MYFIQLPDGRISATTDQATWEHHRAVAGEIATTTVNTPAGDRVQVRTEFTGRDDEAAAGLRPRLLYRTVIHGGPHDGDVWRYPTRARAEQFHPVLARKLTSGTYTGRP